MCDVEIDCQPEDICRDYLRNVCNRGNKCRFKHPPQVLDNFSLTFSFNSDEERLKFSRSVCHDFQNAVCGREGCKYIHCSKDDQEAFMESGTLPACVLEDAIKKSVIPSLPGEAPVCRDYLNGECRRGKMCKFRHLSHSKYRKELDVLFGVEGDHGRSSSTHPALCEPKRMKTSCSSFSHTVDTPFAPAPFTQVFYPHDNFRRVCYTTDSSFGPNPVHSTCCQMAYSNNTFCDRNSDMTQHPTLQEENSILKQQIMELKKQVSDLKAANEFLLDQNATLRMARKNGGVVTLQTPPNASLVTTPVAVQPATGQLVAVSGQNAPTQQIVTAAVPVSIAPVAGPGAGQMTLSTVAMTGQGNTQQLVPVSCNTPGQQIMAAVSSVTVAGQNGASPAILATAVPVSQQQLVSNAGNQLVSVSAVPVSLGTVSMAHVHMQPIVTAASDPPHSIAMSVSAGTPLVSYPIMTQHLLPTR